MTGSERVCGKRVDGHPRCLHRPTGLYPCSWTGSENTCACSRSGGAKHLQYAGPPAGALGRWHAHAWLERTALQALDRVVQLGNALRHGDRCSAGCDSLLPYPVGDIAPHLACILHPSMRTSAEESSRLVLRVRSWEVHMHSHCHDLARTRAITSIEKTSSRAC